MNNKGFTLIEGIISLLILGIAAVSILSLYIGNIASSADDMEYRQSVQLAKSMLEEIMSKPITYCDLDDDKFLTATSSASCTIPEVMGPEVGETRYSSTTPFDNVNDYNGFSMVGIKNIGGNAIMGLENYNLTVTISSVALSNIPIQDGFKISVSITSPRGTVFTLEGYKTRYAPNL